MRYFFYILDSNRSGLIEKVRAFVSVMVLFASYFCRAVQFARCPMEQPITTAFPHVKPSPLFSPTARLPHPTTPPPLLQTELKHFVANMWEKELLTNVTDGLAYLDSIDDGDGAFNVAQIEAMQKRYPIVMYPLYRLQVYEFRCFVI